MGVGKMMERLSKEDIKFMRQFDSCTQMNKNCIRFDSKSGLRHKLAILDWCKMLLKEGQDFFTRARLKENDACADLFILQNRQIIEFVDSESMESIERKRKLWTERHFNFDFVRVV
jgi:hypothetical protein